MLQKLIQGGESKTVEFKERFPKNNQIAQTVCAFANRAGGHILIGISDQGEIVGVDDEALNETLEKVPNIIHDSIYPMILPEIYTYTVKGKKILVIQIYPGSNTPYFMKEKGKLKGTYVRVGRTNKLADEEMLKELERQKINKSFDEDIFDELTVPITQELTKLLSGRFGQEITKEKLLNLHLIEQVGECDYLTNAGAIMIGQSTNASMKCAKFLGESIVNFIDKKEYEGDVFSVLENTMAFLKNHLNLSGIIQGSGLRRRDVLEIPEEVLREGIINAMIHRDYAMMGSDIKVAVFESRIEITSPGGLPKSISVEEIYAGRSEIRNRVLSNVFLKLGLIEQWGSGIPRMREMCKEMGLREPEIKEVGLFVILTIYRRSANETQKIEKPYKQIKPKSFIIEEEKETIYDILRTNQNINVKELSTKLDLTEASVQRRLQALQDEQRIKRIGAKKSGHWEVQE